MTESSRQLGLDRAVCYTQLTMAELRIRRAQAADVPRLALLNAEVQQLHCSHRPELFKPVNLSTIEQWLASLLQEPDTRLWLAELEAAAVGYVVASEQRRSENAYCLARHWWEIDMVGVAAQHRQGGIGRALLETVIAEAHRHGVQAVELCAWAFNTTAQRAFEQLGFSPKTVRYELKH